MNLLEKISSVEPAKVARAAQGTSDGHRRFRPDHQVGVLRLQCGMRAIE